jgi:hypothetical protein
MANVSSNHHKYQLANAFYGTGTFRLILMATGFTPNIDTHENLDDISASELSAGNGYSTGGAILANIVITEDDTNDKANVAWDTVIFTASGGSIGPSPYATIYKDSGTPATSPVVGFIDFSGDKTVTDGQPFQITTPNVDIT